MLTVDATRELSGKLSSIILSSLTSKINSSRILKKVWNKLKICSSTPRSFTWKQIWWSITLMKSKRSKRSMTTLMTSSIRKKHQHSFQLRKIQWRRHKRPKSTVRKKLSTVLKMGNSRAKRISLAMSKLWEKSKSRHLKEIQSICSTEETSMCSWPQ